MLSNQLPEGVQKLLVLLFVRLETKLKRVVSGAKESWAFLLPWRCPWCLLDVGVPHSAFCPEAPCPQHTSRSHLTSSPCSPKLSVSCPGGSFDIGARE